jgi:hypothetical protein
VDRQSLRVESFAPRKKFIFFTKWLATFSALAMLSPGMSLCEQPDNKHFLVMRLSFDYRPFNPEPGGGEMHGS